MKDQKSAILKNHCDLGSIPEIEVQPSQMADPLELIEALESKYAHTYGAVKLRMPSEWKPQFYFSCIGKRISYRVQVLNELRKCKAFVYEHAKLFMNEFETHAKRYAEKNIANGTKLETIEQLFWSIVDNPDGIFPPFLLSSSKL